jgi:hypothetical protein
MSAANNAIEEHTAQKRVCPFTFNIPEPADGQLQCVGSKCMAWRWEPDIGDGHPTGYCGAFGKP